MLSRVCRETRRFVSGGANFAAAAGFHETTGVSDYAKRPLFVGDGPAISYGDFNERIGQYAEYLNGTLGLTKGDRLIARTSKSVDNIALYLATLRIGAIYIPLNPGYTQKETNHFVSDSRPTVLVTCNFKADEPFQNSIRHVVCEDVLAKEASKMEPALEVESMDPLDVASVCYTSGTTGLPKGAMITHGGITANAEGCVEAWRFTERDVQLHFLPSYHIHGLFIAFNCSLLTKSSLIWQSKFTVDDALKWLPKATVMMGVPTYFHRLTHSEHFSQEVVRNVRLFVSGSAPLSPAVWEEFRQRTGIPILERYGMTETLVSTTNPYEASKRVPGSVGPPLPGCHIRLNKDEVIEYRGPSVFKGYWNLPEKTLQDFTQDGWFITGDVGRIDENGYVHIMGRSKDMIISGGLNVYPKEVEDVVDKLSAVKESAVIAVPHPDFGEAVVAVAVKANGVRLSDDELSEEIVRAAKSQLANYKVPKRVVVLEEMPRNAMGKIQKKQLRDDYKHLFQ